MRRLFSLMSAAAVGVVLPSSVPAQIVDYAGLNEAFGEPITTSVTGKPQRASEAPASLTIVTREQIERSPARNVPDLLKAYAGVDVNRWTAGQNDVAIRGGVQTYSARLLVLVDGRQVYLDHYGMTDWNLLGVELDDIQQIELVRGPASALFGFNAASGVVNIITRAGRDRHADATAEIGTRGYRRLGGVISLPIGGSMGLKIAGGHQQEHERAIPERLYQPPTTSGVEVDHASATLSMLADTATSIELDTGFASNRQLEFLPSQILTEQRFRSQTAGIRVNHDTDWGSLSGRSYTNWLRADYGITTPVTDPYNAVADLRVRNRITVAEGAALIRFGAGNTIRIGSEYRNNQLMSDTLFSRRIGYQGAAADVMLDLHPDDAVGLTGAVRVDHLWLSQGGIPLSPQIDPIGAYRRSITPVSFNAAATVRIGEDRRLRINGGRGLQLPSLIGLGLRVLVPAPDVPIPVYLTGDPGLSPVSVWSGELNYSQDLPSDVHLNATVFYTRAEDLIASPGGSVDVQVVLAPDPVAVTRFANVGSFHSYGVEAAASGRFGPTFGWSVNYTLTQVDEDIPANRDAPFFALFPKVATPRHRANLTLDYGKGKWSAVAVAHLTAVSYQSSFLPSTELILVRVPATIGIDAKVSRSLTPRLSIYAGGENLSNARGAYGSPIPADRRLRLGISAKL